MRPFFLAVKKEHYLAYKSGKKKTEYRLERGAFNPRQLYPGRLVTISNGYRKKGRLFAMVVRIRRSLAGGKRKSFISIYGRGLRAFCIDLDVKVR